MPDDAHKVLPGTDIDYLAMGSYLAEKPFLRA